MSSVSTFIVEDSPVIRDNLIAALEEMADVKVVGAVAEEDEAVRWLRQANQACDLVIIDIFLRQGSGLGVLRAAAESGLAARRVVLTNYATPDMRRRCEELGADRVFDKSQELDELIAYCAQLGAQLADGRPQAAGPLA